MKKAKVLDPTAAGQGGKNNIIVLSPIWQADTGTEPCPTALLLNYWNNKSSHVLHEDQLEKHMVEKNILFYFVIRSFSFLMVTIPRRCNLVNQFSLYS